MSWRNSRNTNDTVHMKKHEAPKRIPWPRLIKIGRTTVKIYRRKMPSGNWGYRIPNYSSGKRRFDCHPDETEAIEAATRLARKLSERQHVAANMTNSEAAGYAAAVQSLEPHSVPLTAAADTLSQCLQTTGTLAKLIEATSFWAARNRVVTRGRVGEVVEKLLAFKNGVSASERYLKDLRLRLGRFAADFPKHICDVTTPEIQDWLDCLGLSNCSYGNYRRALHVLFEFAVARGFAIDNPVKATQAVKADKFAIQIFTPSEMRKLLTATSNEFLPSIVLGAFAGLRSAEIKRLTWDDIRLAERHVVVGKDKSKTASRRIIPIWENCATWLAPYVGHAGAVWGGGYSQFYAEQKRTAKEAGIAWKRNGLRHSYASYRFAQTMDAGRVAGELGNSAVVVHRHYRELVTPKAGEEWFAIKPSHEASNIISSVG
jgi:integrase